MRTEVWINAERGESSKDGDIRHKQEKETQKMVSNRCMNQYTYM